MTEGFPPAGENTGDQAGQKVSAENSSAPLTRPRRTSAPARPLVAAGVSRRSMLVSGATAVAAAGGTGYLLMRGGGSGSATAAATLTTEQAVAGSASTGAGLTTSAGTGAAVSSSGASATVLHGSSKAATLTGTTGAAAAAKKKIKVDADLLIGRATYGRTVASDRSIERLGASAWLERQLRPAKIKDPKGQAVDAQFPDLRWSIAQTRSGLKVGAWDVMMDVCANHLGRALFSSRELYEVMVDFWSNHLNIACPSSDVWDTRHRYQIDVVRKHALGSFEDLLLASAFHPAMLTFLDAANSTKDAPNENYARELLELHTVGVNGGYTEKDIQRSALLLTGWTFWDGKRKYEPQRHYTGRIKAYGFSIANADAAKGQVAQRKYLRYLARHPKTARNIATKLATHFVSDSPPKSLVTSLAKVYTKNDTAIVPVLRALFSSPEFAASSGEKIRRPMEQVVASARAIGVKNGSNGKALLDLYYVVKDAGHGPLGWSMPNGYADRAASWQSPAGALQVFNSTTAMVHGWWPSKMSLPGPEKLLGKKPTTRAGVITAVGKKIFGRNPTKRERSAAVTLLNGTKLPKTFNANSWEQHETIALTATLFLSAPAHLSV
ncbi:DUF1800 domain-containing protein [Kineosporia rhizophila]|uniref:DUF1800 domain-containing protein n=1 Tax=Kineosporia TaxID=49184 RepID=UPI001E338443|nr:MULTISPECIES: DUF1800 domain-containing protein [Kineosporia]MCE0539027.1 DUF1800 domain-containing protein [Kineosporia rhizophila]GLY17871.1 hypothetical protein Kisp01_48850 [Kineosporia sp. NBRC 101677]